MSSILVVAPTGASSRLIDILRAAGYVVLEAESEASALNTLCYASPGLILMTILMPDSNGLEVAARLRQHLTTKLPPIVLLGTIRPIGIDEEPLVSVVSGYLDIDTSSNDLLAAVQQYVPLPTSR